MRALFAIGALVCALAASCGAGQGATAGLGPASDFTLRTTTGDTFRMSEHLGEQVIVMSFWTSFCPSCRNELQALQGLYEELSDEGLLVLGVALDPPETVADVRTVARRLGFTFPVLLDEESRVAALYNPRAATPFTVLVDGRGRRVWAHEGYVSGDLEEIDAKVRALLAERNAPAPGGPGSR
ncbi:MAG: TlpA family protein disulfide reductase [Deltaproteobacteria bacterium]|nr:TlpA family protein disulfide reductase [Deltaproteobacteria bacterium]